MSHCPLCDKLVSPAADEVVAEFPHSVAMLSPWQYHTGSCVLVSRVHVAELHHLDVRAAFVEESCRLSRAIEAAFRPWKMNVESLGNVVPHLHWHHFARRADDSERLKAVWVGFDCAERDAAEKLRLESGILTRVETIERLRRAIADV